MTEEFTTWLIGQIHKNKYQIKQSKRGGYVLLINGVYFRSYVYNGTYNLHIEERMDVKNYSGSGAEKVWTVFDEEFSLINTPKVNAENQRFFSRIMNTVGS